MKYIIAEASIRNKLIDKVNDLLTKGWKPQGGLVISTKTVTVLCHRGDGRPSTDQIRPIYAQALVVDESM
jgi:hypothetical protein